MFNLIFFSNDTATTQIYTLSLHDALPISRSARSTGHRAVRRRDGRVRQGGDRGAAGAAAAHAALRRHRRRPGHRPGRLRTPAQGMGRRGGAPREDERTGRGRPGGGARQRRRMTTPAFGRFFLPGPTDVHPDVLAAMQRPMIGHRSSAMEQLLGGLQPPLARLFRTSRLVLVGTTSATGFMELAVRNGVRHRALCLVNGSFSERFANLVRACGKECVRLDVPLGCAVEPDMLRDTLRRTPVDAVTLVHSETSTGVLQDVEALAGVVREFDDVLLLVDAVTSLAGSPVETDPWGLDFVLTGSQKALALPPGLALGVASERMLERAKTLPNRGLY